jgi:hypothetical protein
VATKKGMSVALAVAIHAGSDLTAYSMQRLGGVLEALLRRAADAGVIRDDISSEDVLRTVVGLCYTRTISRVGKATCTAWWTCSLTG